MSHYCITMDLTARFPQALNASLFFVSIRNHWDCKRQSLHYLFLMFPVLFISENLQLHANDLSGSVSEELCNRRGEGFKDIQVLTVDCLGDAPEVSCTCCTNCPQGL